MLRQVKQKFCHVCFMLIVLLEFTIICSITPLSYILNQSVSSTVTVNCTTQLFILLVLNHLTICFFQILCDLLSPSDDNVKVGLRETTQNTSPHSKTLVASALTQPQSPTQRQPQHQLRATSVHHQGDNEEVKY